MTTYVALLHSIVLGPGRRVVMADLKAMAAEVGFRKGDVVLMAPATSSFDLYANYEERGKDFKRIVGKLS